MVFFRRHVETVATTLPRRLSLDERVREARGLTNKSAYRRQLGALDLFLLLAPSVVCEESPRSERALDDEQSEESSGTAYDFLQAPPDRPVT